jgi:ABC-type lipoprotein release transport system permease subunit
VASITSFGLQELDARRALINDESLRCYLAENGREITGRPGDFLGLRFFPPVDTMSDASLESESFHLRSIITSNLRDSDPEIKTWRSQNRNYFRSIGFDRTVLSIVLGFLTLAASLNVAAALFVIFFERDKDMMTLRAIGMTPGQMKNWILIQGFVMGLVGTALGLGGSYLISFIFEKWKLVALPAEVYHIDHLV